MSHVRMINAMAAVCFLAVGGRAFAEWPVFHRAGGLMLTEADLQRIEDESGAAARGGMVRIVECEGAFGYATIQSAIDASSDGDVVVVLPNDCETDGMWRQKADFQGKSIRLQGANPEDPNVVSATIILNETGVASIKGIGITDGMSTFEVAGLTLTAPNNMCFDFSDASVTLDHVVVHSSRIPGSITGGPQHTVNIKDTLFQNNGPVAFACRGAATYVISKCVFDVNHGSQALTVDSALAYIFDCRFSFNVPDDTFDIGGAIRFGARSGSIIQSCEFIGNRSSNGAIYIMNTLPLNSSGLLIRSCLFAKNTGHSGSAAKINFGKATFEGCTFSGNDTAAFSTIVNANATLVIRSSVFWSNRLHMDDNTPEGVVTFADISNSLVGGWNNVTGPGNINTDPLFVDPGHWDDNGTPGDLTDDMFVPGDYHLLPGSPCIDAGDPAFVAAEGETDLDGNPRVLGCQVDMGAYEAPRGAPGSGDFNGDAAVDLGDLTPFVDALIQGGGGACMADLNGDGFADGGDLQLFVDSLL